MAVLNTSPSSHSLAVGTTTTTSILKLYLPALTHSIHLASFFQRVLSATTLFVWLRAYFLSAIILRQGFYASKVLLLQSYYAAAVLSKQVLLSLGQAVKFSWRATEKFRGRLYFEFMVFILGGGNGLVLVLFWPGWLVIGGTVWAVYWIFG